MMVVKGMRAMWESVAVVDKEHDVAEKDKLSTHRTHCLPYLRERTAWSSDAAHKV